MTPEAHLKRTWPGLLLCLFATAVSAEECAETPSALSGKYSDLVATAKCEAIVDDVVRVDADGFVQTSYIVQYKGQRTVVGAFGQSRYAKGDKISFTVMKFESHSIAGEPITHSFIAQMMDLKAP